MRRKDREITDFGKIEKIISLAGYMHLGLFDEGYPYVVPLHYGYIFEAESSCFMCTAQMKDISSNAKK